MTAHVVLGGAGVVGRETVAALLTAGRPVRSVTRTTHATDERGAERNVGIEHATADLLDAASTAQALQGADVAYLTVGLTYTTRSWRRDWPTVLRHTIDACVANGTHLVHFDNVYAYGRAGGTMTESSPIRPSSRKGAVRAELLAMLDSARAERGLEVTVARSADFYGPGASTSAFNSFAIDAVADGKPPTWLFDASQPHSMTYTPDIGAALAVLGTDERARGRTWHLPTAPALTGEQYLALAGAGANLPHRTMSAATMRVGALFSSAARETLEMAYQYTAPYVFDSSSFERMFGLRPTPYADGIAAALEHARSARRVPGGAQLAASSG